MNFKSFYKRILLLLLLLFCVSIETEAQEDTGVGSWYAYHGYFDLSPKFELFGETQLRTANIITDLENFVLRSFINYNLYNNVQFGISQEYHDTKSYSDQSNNNVDTQEYRIALQAILHQKIKRISISHRYRYEFRFLDQSGNQRIRYHLQFSMPLAKKDAPKKLWSATLANEILINTKPEVNISENRLYGMIGYQFTKTTNLQFGYMYIFRPDQTNLPRLQFTLTQRLKFYK